MLFVTTSAKEKLKDELKKEKNDDLLIRIGRTLSESQQLGFTLDKKKEGDHVVEDNEGEGLLLVGEDIAPILNKYVLNYKDTGEGMKFTIDPY